MHKGRFLTSALALLVILGLLIASSVITYGMGWMRAYRMNQSAESQENVIPHMMPFGFHRAYPRPYWGLGFLALGARLVLRVGLFLLVIAMVTRFFHRREWKANGGPQGRHWTHWHPPHGPVPPWHCGWHRTPEETVGKVRQDTADDKEKEHTDQ